MNIRITNSHQLYVRYAETDKMGVVYNVNYFIYFETGRNEIMRFNNMSLLDYEENEKVYFPVIDSFGKFHISAHYDDFLTIDTVMIYDGSAVFRFEYTIRRGDDIICTGYTRHCFINQSSMKPVKPPKRFVDTIINIFNTK